MTTQAEYAERRERFLEQMGAGVAVIAAAPVAVRNNDVHHAYRQHSDFHYLTGFDEPHSVLVLTNQHQDQRMVMFVQKRDPERETWDGPRAGVDGARRDFGADAAFTIEELDDKLPGYLLDVARLHYAVGHDREFDARIFDALANVRGKARAGKIAPREIIDPGLLLHAMRLKKSASELEVMSRAAAITARAHARAMQVARPGAFEYEVEAAIIHEFRAGGAERPAYESIVGSGKNATILHYIKNDRQLRDGDLLLIDAGCELDYYASDVTRTFPVNGQFSEAQRSIYDVVLRAQLAAIDAVKPGNRFTDPHQAALEGLVEGLVEHGIVEGPVPEAIDEERYKPYFMHRTSHWLGMDVHDVGDYYVDKKPRALEPGMVLTIEPGLYIAEDARVEERFRGIGVRIEDDVAVTDTGHHVITAAIDKDPDSLEKLLQARA